MKKLLIMTIIVGLVIINGQALANNITDHPAYHPSTGLSLGAWGTEWGGSSGWVIADPFQINLLYQPGILDSDIDAFNAYNPDGTWTYNFSDNDEYVLNVNIFGGLPLYTYPDLTTAADYQWTLTGWHQTIFAGYIEDWGGGTWFLRVDPTQGYRSFPSDPPVNNVEVFGGVIWSEVVGYTFQGTSIDDLGQGATLGVELNSSAPVPIPGAVWLLGSGLLGMVGLKRRFRV